MSGCVWHRTSTVRKAEREREKRGERSRNKETVVEKGAKVAPSCHNLGIKGGITTLRRLSDGADDGNRGLEEAANASRLLSSSPSSNIAPSGSTHAVSSVAVL